jgi:hypothetical protein
VSTVEREEATGRHSSVVGRKDEGRWAAGCSEERQVGGVTMDHAVAREENSMSGEYGFDLVFRVDWLNNS